MKWLTQQFELARAGGGHDVRAMEGLRGLAIFLVFLVHYVTLVDPYIALHRELRTFAAALHTIGNTGVDLFFVLSGYLIYGSLISRRQPFLRFMARRVERIYPAFLVVLAIYLVLSFVFPAERKIPASAAAAVIYLLENVLLLPGLFPIPPMITVAWSLSYEMFYYLTIPLIITVLGLRARGARFRVTLFVGLAIATAAVCAVYGGPVRLVMFIAGILLYEAVSRKAAPATPGVIGLAATVLALLATLWPTMGPAGFTLKVAALFVAFFLLCHSCFGHPATWLAHAFSWAPLRWLGNMSYSYYLIHGLTLKAAFMALGAVLPPGGRGGLFFFVLLGAAMFAVTLIVSAALFLTVERPFSLFPARTRKNSVPVSASAA